jgi:hypothetical protein
MGGAGDYNDIGFLLAPSWLMMVRIFEERELGINPMRIDPNREGPSPAVIRQRSLLRSGPGIPCST